MDKAGPVDLFVIGGGINGCGIARDAAGRGLSVALAEMNDLASGTSSASTKLFHGGLRYLEQYEFRLVREALIERETLLRAMPHISWPMRFVLPHHRGLRPAWLLRLGLFIYDHLGGRKILPPTRSLDLARDPAGAPLKDEFARGFEYSDCWVEDSRLVALNARDAARSLLGDDAVWEAERSMGAEDFAHYAHEVPGFLVRVAVPGQRDALGSPLGDERYGTQIQDAATLARLAALTGLCPRVRWIGDLQPLRPGGGCRISSVPARAGAAGRTPTARRGRPPVRDPTTASHREI